MLPNVQIVELNKQCEDKESFLRICKRDLKLIYENNEESKKFTLCSVERDKNDAVAIVAYTGNKILLRSCIRPALKFGNFNALNEDNQGHHFEIPAGLIELDEIGIDGIFKAGSRELYEETGYDIPYTEFRFLGKRTFPAVGMSSERIFLLEVDITNHIPKTPITDGHPLEQYGKSILMDINEIKNKIKDGEIFDSKTEIGIYRFLGKHEK